ncbi:MAG: CDP-alcohol phosphatidyltransferase family protein [Actinomycetota bacterium]
MTSNRVLTVPNVLSGLRLASVPVFLYLFVTGYQEAAVLLYAAGALTDFFDGVIARRLDQISELGKLLDPLADRVFIVALAVALVAVDALPWVIAGAIVVRDLLLLSIWPLFERRGVGRIPVNFTGKTATAMLLFGLTCMAVAETDFPPAGIADEIGLVFVVGGAVLYYVAAGMYAREAYRRLASLRGADPSRS